MGEPSCELPLANPGNGEIDAILARSKIIAVVGLSDKPDRESYQVARYLKGHGYRIVPVNPAVGEILDEPAYPDIAAIPGDVAIDIVDIFRKPEYIPTVVEQAIARRVKVVWMQLGLVHNAAAERARAAGISVVMDRCIKIEHTRWAGSRTRGETTGSSR